MALTIRLNQKGALFSPYKYRWTCYICVMDEDDDTLANRVEQLVRELDYFRRCAKIEMAGVYISMFALFILLLIF